METNQMLASAEKNTLDLEFPVLKNGKYENPWDTWKKPSLWNFVKFKVKDVDRSNIPGPEELDKTLPIIKPDFSALAAPPSSDVQVMWIGHASVLVQLHGVTILTDPIFSDRCAPIQKVGPKRYRPPPCSIQELPPVDVVLISHNHYDHLDYASVKQLNQRFGESLKWFVPMGMKSWFIENGSSNVSELSWWQEEEFTKHLEIKQSGEERTKCSPVKQSREEFNKDLEVKKTGENFNETSEIKQSVEELSKDSEVKEVDSEFIKSSEIIESGAAKDMPTVVIAFAPTQHWSKRTLLDENKSLWGSWVVKGPKNSFYFAGDTGYCRCFKQIGQKYGPFTVAAIPIGSYEPRWFMFPQHVNPEEAMQIHRDVKSQHSLGIHWGTFKQFGCYEFYLEPKQKISEEVQRLGLAEDAFVALYHGEVKTFRHCT